MPLCQAGKGKKKALFHTLHIIAFYGTTIHVTLDKWRIYIFFSTDFRLLLQKHRLAVDLTWSALLLEDTVAGRSRGSEGELLCHPSERHHQSFRRPAWLCTSLVNLDS